MPARLAYSMFYTSIKDRLTEEGKIKFDALLGDEAAQRELDRRRKMAVSTADFEVG